MNCKDIEAAKRLIAQFEERADGRHNSTALEIRQTETKPVEVEKPNDLPVTYQPSHEGVRFTDGFQGYMEYLRRRFRIPLDEEIQRLETIALGIKSRWEDCEIGEYCQIPGTQFEPHNPEQTILMVVPISNRPHNFEYWCGTVPQMSVDTRRFQQAILWRLETGSRPFWKRIE